MLNKDSIKTLVASSLYSFYDEILKNEFATTKYVDSSLTNVVYKGDNIPYIEEENIIYEITQEQINAAWIECQASTDTSMYIELPAGKIHSNSNYYHYIECNGEKTISITEYDSFYGANNDKKRYEIEFDVDPDGTETNNISSIYIGTNYDKEWNDVDDKVLFKLDRYVPAQPPVITGSIKIIEQKLNSFNSYYLGRNFSYEGAVTIGYRNNKSAIGEYSLSIGSSNALGSYSFAQGSSSATGRSSHAQGDGTTASNWGSHAEGSNTEASGMFSHSEGSFTKSSGNYSHAEGYCTIASSDYQHSQGKYNIEDKANKYAHIVGNGLDEKNRKNAYTLDWKGNAWYAGKLSQEGTPTDNKDLTNKKYVDDLVESSKTAMCTDEEVDNMLNEVLGGDYSGN